MGAEAEVGLLYWVFKWLLFVPVVRLVCRPWIEGAERIPAFGPAILVSNHISAGDTFLLRPRCGGGRTAGTWRC